VAHPMQALIRACIEVLTILHQLISRGVANFGTRCIYNFQLDYTVYLPVIISYLSSCMRSSFWFVSLSYSIVVYLVLVCSSFLHMLTCMLYLVLTGYMYFCCVIQCCPTWQLVIVITDCHMIAAVCQHELK